MKRILYFFLLISAASDVSFAQWTKTIDCPANRVYRDIRPTAGGEEFCQHVLPGSLVVNDGPYRFWYNPDFQGASGNFAEGRKVGAWKECDRFGRCKQPRYPANYPEETRRPRFQEKPPVSFVNGKYVFDFASCRSTWIAQTAGGKTVLELNINGTNPSGCEVTYIPANVTGGGEGEDYTCKVPYSTGKREIGSLDLIAELPKLGLPQYCERPAGRSGPYPGSVDPSHGDGLAQVFTSEFSIGNNGVDIAQARLHFQASATSRTNRCVVRYDPGTKNLYLLSDQGGKYLGPIAANGDGSLWNSRCLLSGCSNAEVTGNVLRVHLAVRFNPTQFAGSHRLFLEMVDTDRISSPAADLGSWTVPARRPETTEPAWPADRGCPPKVPAAPLGIYTASVIDCKDISGTWSDPDTNANWSLSQVADRISGSVTIAKPGCGTVSWRVTGQMKDGVATLTGTGPDPAVDECGVAAKASISATLTPDCQSGTGKTEIKE